jgi:hypothetical protein
MTPIAYIYEILVVVIVTIGVFRYNSLNIPFKILVFSMIATLVIAILSNIFIVKYKSNAPVLHLEAITEFVFYALVYYYLFTSRRIKKIVVFTIIAASIFSVINALILQPFHTVFPTYVNLPTLGLLVVFSLLLFKQMLLYPLNTPILKQGVFWFNTAMIFYATTLFLNIGLSNVQIRNPSLDYLLYYFWYTILFIFTILIGVAFLIDNKQIDKAHAI